MASCKQKAAGAADAPVRSAVRAGTLQLVFLEEYTGAARKLDHVGGCGGRPVAADDGAYLAAVVQA
jgi:hypothetical protein